MTEMKMSFTAPPHQGCFPCALRVHVSWNLALADIMWAGWSQPDVGLGSRMLVEVQMTSVWGKLLSTGSIDGKIGLTDVN